MKTLQGRLISILTPPLPRAKVRYMVESEARNKEGGAILLHDQQDEPLKPIGYWSRSFTQAESLYDTSSCERLTVVLVILLLRPYLGGSRFTVRTEHSVLRWILSVSHATVKLAQ